MKAPRRSLGQLGTRLTTTTPGRWREEHDPLGRLQPVTRTEAEARAARLHHRQLTEEATR